MGKLLGSISTVHTLLVGDPGLERCPQPARNDMTRKWMNPAFILFNFSEFLLIFIICNVFWDKINYRQWSSKSCRAYTHIPTLKLLSLLRWLSLVRFKCHEPTWEQQSSEDHRKYEANAGPGVFLSVSKCVNLSLPAYICFSLYSCLFLSVCMAKYQSICVHLHASNSVYLYRCLNPSICSATRTSLKGLTKLNCKSTDNQVNFIVFTLNLQSA